jgi:hypothetical protein
MPRRSRLSLPGIPWHIIQRGNNRSACFFTEDDYRFYLDRLAELSKKFGAALGDQRFQAEIERALGRRATRGKAGRRPKAQAEHHSKQLGLL